MIYLDTSVVLSHLFAEDRHPPAELWDEQLVSSRLLQYETWTRVHARRMPEEAHEAVRATLGRVAMLELAPPVLVRALDPFPMPVRTLDALHLASLEFLRAQGHDVAIAAYDRRLLDAAGALGVALSRYCS